jgi:SAM-dependent methyltransferase
MLSKLLPYMRCPYCSSRELKTDIRGLACPVCGKFFPLQNGILDMLQTAEGELITPFQKLMQTTAIVSIYEKIWRRMGYFLASSRSFGKEMDTVLQFGKGKCTGPLLDLACGTGVFTRPLSLQGASLVVGLDLSRPMLNRAQTLSTSEGIRNVLFVRGTAFSIPFSEAAFQYVNCCGALHLFDRPKSALEEIRRVLYPEGYLCVQTTIRPERSAGTAYFLERFIRFGFFDEEELQKMVRELGFEIIQSERHRISYTFLARRLR